jgi:RNA polymerase sigma-70 factor, ECF subfamily
LIQYSGKDIYRVPKSRPRASDEVWATSSTIHRARLSACSSSSEPGIGARSRNCSSGTAPACGGRSSCASNAAVRAEQILQVQEAVNSLEPLDREVVALRHFEQLTRGETAGVLGISEEAGAKRYIRALKKLKSNLAAMPGGLEGF